MSVKLFGTDGIRGQANIYPITPEICVKFGMAAAHYFLKDDTRHRVVIAKDTRLSGYMIEPALTSGFISMGMDVILLGPMPTPAVSMLIRSLRADLGVMITASHNKSTDNGLKLFNSLGSKLTDEVESKIEDLILNFDFSSKLVSPQKLGRAKRLDDAPGRYVEHVKRSFPKGASLANLKVVVDCGNGASYNLAPWIFWELGAEIIKINCEPNGFNINDNCGSQYPGSLQNKVKEVKADIGIAFDGDADRVVICDENGELIDGDILIALIAHEMKHAGTLKSNKIVVTEMSNLALDSYFSTLGIEVIRTKVGDRHVADAMAYRKASLGAENSGHIILSEFSNSGDGMIAALQVLSSLARCNTRMSKLANIFKLYPQVLKNVPYHKDNPLERSEIKTAISNIQTNNKDVRFLIRKSGTEKLIRILVEGKDINNLNNIANEIVGLISANNQ